MSLGRTERSTIFSRPSKADAPVPPAFFPDNTTLINFEIIKQWDLLAALVGNSAAWVASVEDECRDWVKTYSSIHASAAAQTPR